MLTPLASAICAACPIRPKPVTSVAARAPALTAISAATRFSVAIWRVSLRASAGSRRWRLSAVESTPVPSGLVSSSRSPGRAPALSSIRRRAPSIPPNTVRRSSGPSFEAQPAHATSAVSRTSMRRRSLAARRPVRGVAGGAGAVVESAPTPDRHRVDLDARAKRETRGRERGARRRIAREGPGVDLVHLLEVLHVGEEYRGLHHVRECEPSPRQHGLEIAQDLFGLFG